MDWSLVVYQPKVFVERRIKKPQITKSVGRTFPTMKIEVKYLLH